MNCDFHSKRESVAKCKICGRELCEECNNVQTKYDACPSCAKGYVTRAYENVKNGFLYNILSIICSVAFLTFYIIEVALGKLNTTFIVIGAVIVALLIPVSVFMFCYSIRNMKNYKKIIDIIEN